MSAGKTTFDWIVLEHEEDEFPPPSEEAGPAQAGRGSFWARRVWPAVGACVLLAAFAAGGQALMHTADEGLATIDRELEATMALEQWSAAPRQALAPELASAKPVDRPDGGSIAAAPQAQAQPANTEVLDVAFHGDLAVADVVETRVYPDGQASALRKLRFYRHNGVEWVPAAPDDAFWGPSLTLETEHLAFTYRRRDRLVVEPAALLMEEAYISMHETFGLLPPSDKLAITVAPTRSRMFVPSLRDNVLSMTSPSLLPRPADLPQDQLLAWQALPLLAEFVMNETGWMGPVHENWDYMARVTGQWLVLQHNPLQAAWIADVRQWQRGQYAAHFRGDAPDETDDLAALCIKHRIQERLLWFVGSGDFLSCVTGFMVANTIPFYSNVPLKLSQTRQTYSAVPCPISYQPSPILATTIVDYAVAEYGPDAVARLWQGFHDYPTWDELIPAVFGVTAQKFERGWQGYQTGVGIHSPQNID